MKLEDWIKSQGRSITSVAKEWGVAPSTLTRAIKGERWPSDLIQVRSHIVSDGQIGTADWIETCRPALIAGGILQPEKEATNG